MISKENKETLLYLKLIIQQSNITTPDSQLSTRLGHPQGTTLHIFHFITIHRNASLFSQDRSWQLTSLLYHVLRVDYHFHLPIKFNLLQLKYSHLQHSGVYVCFSGDSPMCWHHSLILRYASENSECPKSTLSVFSTHHSKFSHLSFYLYTW